MVDGGNIDVGRSDVGTVWLRISCDEWSEESDKIEQADDVDGKALHFDTVLSRGSWNLVRAARHMLEVL